jgi:hypothetical protein
MKTLTIITALLLSTLAVSAQKVAPHKVIRVYDLNLRGNKAQEKQIKESANWPVLSTKLIRKGVIKFTFYTNANSY